MNARCQDCAAAMLVDLSTVMGEAGSMCNMTERRSRWTAREPLGLSVVSLFFSRELFVLLVGVVCVWVGCAKVGVQWVLWLVVSAFCSPSRVWNVFVGDACVGDVNGCDIVIGSWCVVAEWVM